MTSKEQRRLKELVYQYLEEALRFYAATRPNKALVSLGQAIGLASLCGLTRRDLRAALTHMITFENDNNNNSQSLIKITEEF